MPTYVGIRYRQTTEKSMVLFVADAEEIRTWAGVPHKTTDFYGGFQRPLEDRFRQIINFFDDKANSSPTSIVVAFRPGQVSVESLNAPNDWPRAVGEYVKITIPDEPLANLPIQDLAARVYRMVSARASNDVREEDNGDDVAVDNEEVEASADTDADVEDDNSEDDDWGVDVGRSALRSFSERIRDATAVAGFIAELEQQIRERNEAIEDPAAEAEGRLRELLISLVQPAMIVDGQHRVWGAAECQRPIPFAVVALEEADWYEQVFQFVIVNKQARPITGEFLASIVNSSLTNREIVELEDRLSASGLKTYETKMLRLMNDDPDSPFAGMVSRGLEEPGRKVTFKAALAVVRRWHKMSQRDEVFRNLFRPALKGTNVRERREEWESLWKDYMFAFWNGIKNLYQGEQLWDPGTQLMYRATLEVLQSNFLSKKSQAGGILYDRPVKLREDVEEFYGNVPAGFFHTEWKRKELLTEDGKKVLSNALNAMRVSGTKLKDIIKSEPLFTGESTKKKKTKGL